MVKSSAPAKNSVQPQAKTAAMDAAVDRAFGPSIAPQANFVPPFDPRKTALRVAARKAIADAAEFCSSEGHQFANDAETWETFWVGVIEFAREQFMGSDLAKRNLSAHNASDETIAAHVMPKQRVVQGSDSQSAIDRCEALLDSIDMLPDACDAAESWREMISGIMETIEESGRVTDKQLETIENVDGGVGRWFR